MGIDLNAFRETFFVEAAEHLDAMEAALLQLDGAHDDRELLNTIFRAAHTIKGGSGTFGMQSVASFTHVVENLLDRLRDGRLAVTEHLVELLFSSLDVMQGLIAAERTGSALPENLEGVRAALELIHNPAQTGVGDVASATASPAAIDAGGLYEVQFHPSMDFFRSGQDPLLLVRELSELGSIELSVLSSQGLPELGSLDPEECHVGWKLHLRTGAGRSAIEDIFAFVDQNSQVKITALTTDAAPSSTSQDSPSQSGAIATAPAANLLASTSAAASIPAASPAAAPSAAVTAGTEKKSGGRSSVSSDNETVRVDRRRLDELINQIGELVIGVSMVEREVLAVNNGNESSAMMQLGKIVRDLQELSLSLRMVPIAATFQKMARVVHDISRKLGKQIDFVTEGDDTELDKSVVDKIGDPLIHMVRNAADHGIELPDVRTAAGKSPTGRVTLRAFQQGGNIFIELTDDGRGLNRQAIMRKAVERGLVAAGETLSDTDICNLIFQPGFSTAKEITDISGRGVGMDVVRRNVEELQGSVQVRSTEGQGSTMTVRLPLTLAILDGLLVQVASEVYVIPLLSVVESISLEPGDVRTLVSSGEVIMLRGEVIPVISLGTLLQGESQLEATTKRLLVIVEDQGRRLALVVDELLGQQQVVIKNLEANFRKVPGVAGATILGDGCVALILDICGIAGLHVERKQQTDSHIPS